MAKDQKLIKITYSHDEIMPPDYDGMEFHIYNAEVIPGESIRIFGTDSNNAEYKPVPFDITFRVGDLVVYDSYNFEYLGKILQISPKTILIDASGTGRGNTRLNLWRFSWYNHDFDLEEIRDRNHRMSLTI